MFRRPLVGVADLDQQRLGEVLADELDAQRQPSLFNPAGSEIVGAPLKS